MSLEVSFAEYDFNKDEDLLHGVMWGYISIMEVFNLDKLNYEDDTIMSVIRDFYLVFKNDKQKIIDCINNAIMIDNYPRLKIDSIIENTKILEQLGDKSEEDVRERLLLHFGLELATVMSIMRYDIDNHNENYDAWLGLFALIGEDPALTDGGLYRWFKFSTIFPTETFELLEESLPKDRLELLNEILH